MLIADLHVHSDHSNDGLDSIKALIAAALEKGLNCISITDHNTVNGSLEAIEYVEEEGLPILIIPGVEISTSDGHLLAYGITEDVDPGMSMKETAIAVKKLGGVTAMAHPFQFYRHGIVRFWKAIDVVDAVEIFNAKFYIGLCNVMSGIIAEKYHKPGIAGSDAHSRSAVGYGITVIDAFDVSSALHSIKKGKTCVKGRRIPISLQIRTTLEKLKRG
ncbi:CehA/McbA family metallohydrolase [Archaeoglobus veneficus]|uniref:PHP domain protein n=1 Tax=Archaeoglobus veneficus (strain DSM 11195 / SNP6) TaxID=693661 RepID=F2KQ53_ARCVS|nr:PHP domain-containing protein [Archaeoglobus veneficus]AEA47656.1 PHP domain protein [Archaeoglobus veneficus SNP6]